MNTPKVMDGVDWSLLLLLSVLWGGAYFFAGVAVQELPPLTVVLARVLLAAIVLLPLFWYRGFTLPRTIATWLPFLMMGLLNNVLPFGLIFAGQTFINVGLSSIINATTPLMTILVMASFGEERVTLFRVIGVLLGVVGVAVLRGIDGNTAPDQLIGIGLCLAAAVSYGFAALWGRRFLNGVPPVKSATLQLMSSTLIVGIAVSVIDKPWTLPMPSGEVIASVAALAVFGTALAYLVFFNILVRAGASNVMLAHNDRRLRFNMLVSPGSEYVTTAADYIGWALDQPTTKVIGLFLETVRNPDLFLQALERAIRQEIPVVILKVGRTDLSRKMAMSHTGALVGNHDVFEAAMRARGVHLVDTVDEIAATLQIFAVGKPAGDGNVASIHDSGGERELLVDTADVVNVPLAILAPETVARIEPHLEPGVKAENPLDAWASGKHAEETFLEAARAIMDDDGVAVGLYSLDWRQDYYLHEMHARVIKKAANETDKPLIAMSNYSLTVNQELACDLADHGVALIEGTFESLKAVRALLNHRNRVNADPLEWDRRKPSDVEVGEAAGLKLLTDYGIGVPRHGTASNEADALSAAQEIGYPVALKTAAPEIHHKTDAGGVLLGIHDEDTLRSAYNEMASRLGPEVIVTEMVSGDAEWSLGVVNDPDFGPAIMIGPGGIFIELVPERAVLMAPFDVKTARRAILSLRTAKLLTGYRGSKPLALNALAEAASRLSMLAHDYRHVIEELDINPVLVSEHAATPVDVLIKPKDA